MARQIFLFFLAFSFLSFDLNRGTPSGHFPAGKADKVWETPEELTTAESVKYDEERDVLYVSNIAGKSNQKNGKGFIAKVSLDGEILERKWVDELNAPKGMALHQGKLFVTDIDRVHRIDISSGEVEKTYEAPASKFLNDIAIGPDNNRVYISDMKKNSIYRIAQRQLEEWISDHKWLTNPNGLLFEEGHLLVGTRKGILKVDPSNQGITRHVSLKTRSIDGLQSDGNGNYLISDWQGIVRKVAPGKDPQKLLEHKKRQINAADHEFIPAKNLLIVPTFHGNTAVAYKIGD